MDNQEAKLYLSAYRPGGRDVPDPVFQEALRQAEQDPTLKAWFHQEQALDAAVASKLKGIRPPANLKAEILAGQKLAPPPAWWPQLRVWAMAASFVLLAGILALWNGLEQRTGPAPMMAEFRRDVSQVVAGGFVPDRMVGNAAEAREWLASQQAPVSNRLPELLRDPAGYACKVIAWKGTRASMICFKTPQGSVHLFIVDLSGLPGQAPDWKAPAEKIQGLSTLAWTDASKAYVLVSENPDMDWHDWTAEFKSG
jgi:hypothetical protein